MKLSRISMIFVNNLCYDKYTHILNWKLLKVLLKCLLIYACNYSFAHLTLKLWSKVQQVLYGDPIQHNMSSIDVIINIFCYLSKSWWKDAVICLSFMFPSWILVLKLSELVLFLAISCCCKAKSSYAIHIDASERCHYAFSEMFLFLC